MDAIRADEQLHRCSFPHNIMILFLPRTDPVCLLKARDNKVHRGVNNVPQLRAAKVIFLLKTAYLVLLSIIEEVGPVGIRLHEAKLKKFLETQV